MSKTKASTQATPARRYRSGYILLLLAVVVLLGALIANGRPELPPPPERVLVGLVFPGLPAEDISGIQLTIPEVDFTTTLSRDENGAWVVLGEDALIPANVEAAESARLFLSDLPLENSFERGDSAPQDFGFLPEPLYVVVFQLQDGARLSFVVGDANPQGTSYYMAANPNDTIINLIPIDWVDAFVVNMLSLEQTEVLPESTP